MKTTSSNWFLRLSLITSSLWPILGHADEVFVFGAEQAVHVRALAASCAVCHGTLGNAVVPAGARSADDSNPVLAGRTRDDLLEKLLGFRDGTRKATIMHQHSRGLSLIEIEWLAKHFSEQLPVIRLPVTPQKLEASHD